MLYRPCEPSLRRLPSSVGRKLCPESRLLTGRRYGFEYPVGRSGKKIRVILAEADFRNNP